MAGDTKLIKARLAQDKQAWDIFVEKGAELIRDVIRGHTTGLAQPMYVIATNIGKIPLMPDYYIMDKTDQEYTLKNY